MKPASPITFISEVVRTGQFTLKYNVQITVNGKDFAR